MEDEEDSYADAEKAGFLGRGIDFVVEPVVLRYGDADGTLLDQKRQVHRAVVWMVKDLDLQETLTSGQVQDGQQHHAEINGEAEQTVSANPEAEMTTTKVKQEVSDEEVPGKTSKAQSSSVKEILPDNLPKVKAASRTREFEHNRSPLKAEASSVIPPYDIGSSQFRLPEPMVRVELPRLMDTRGRELQYWSQHEIEGTAALESMPEYDGPGEVVTPDLNPIDR
jgi:DNA polymerase III gamma/tau subunit